MSARDGMRNSLTYPDYHDRFEAAADAYRAEVLAEAAEVLAELRDATDMNAADGNRYDFRQRVALRDAEDEMRRRATTGGAA